MADRRSFLGAVSGVAASVLLTAPADAQTAAPTAAPTGPTPKPSASPKPPTALAAAIAASMRRFDPALSDADLDTIARAIDDNRRGEARLNPHRATALRNGDEPVTRFSVRGER
jgi:ABC-type transport system substrate-binding protein